MNKRWNNSSAYLNTSAEERETGRWCVNQEGIITHYKGLYIRGESTSPEKKCSLLKKFCRH